MKRAQLPLTALRSFEAAGRHESFAKAAKELFVSQAAISRQIRKLETRLDVTLFDRLAQGVHLTTSGSQLLEELTQAFDRMEIALSESSHLYRRTDLALSVESGFASCWLLPHLANFHAQHPYIEIDFETDERVIEFRPHEPQLAIRFSVNQTSWKNTEARQLLRITMIPVWTPKLLRGNGSIDHPEDLIRLPLLHEISARDWQYWCGQMAIEYSGPDRGQRYDNQSLIMQAALSGQGVALVDEIFAVPYLKTGELVTAFGSVTGPGAYWLVTPKFSKLSVAGQQFSKWLVDELHCN